ncbi:MAG: MBL fold metallo-hydrolase, partial [Nitrososphaerota archaeon]
MRARRLSATVLLLSLILLAALFPFTTLASPEAGQIRVRWLGLGVLELTTPDYKQMVYVDAMIINNWGFGGFKVPVPPEYSSMESWVSYIKEKNPSIVVFAITHNHMDHVGDLVDHVANLTKVGVKVSVVAQYEWAVLYLGPVLTKKGLDPSQIIVTGGMGINKGGTTVVDGISFTATHAVHSSAQLGSPGSPMGYIININGVTVYVSGDTDIFSEMNFIGDFYRPNLAFLSIGDTFTMGPKAGAIAATYVNPDTVIPYHYGLHPPILGPDAAEAFKTELSKIAPQIKVSIL